MMRYCLIIAVLFVSLSSEAQVRKLVRKGNSEYDKGNFPASEIIFRQAQAVDSSSGDITYNIGNSMYMQKKYQEALDAYQKSLHQEKNPMKMAMNLHNAGNAFFETKNYKESVEAYKKALKLNPSDAETRYNLALAQQRLKDQQNKDNQNKDKNKDNKDNKDKNQNKDKNNQNKDNKDKDKDKDKENKDPNKDKQNKDKQDQDRNQQQQQQQPKISKEDAQRMLDALQTSENGTQERVKAQKVKARQRKTEKNW